MKRMKTNVLKLRSILATQIRSICTISIAAIIGFSMTACATEGEKAASARMVSLKNDANEMSMLTKPPAEGETVIATYSGRYSDSKNGQGIYGMTPEVVARIISNVQGRFISQVYNAGKTEVHPNVKFDPSRAAFNLLVWAREEFPNIDINELSVRSIEETRSPTFELSIDTEVNASGKYNYTATNIYYLKGVVVRLPKEKR
jgi:hypothetical protein